MIEIKLKITLVPPYSKSLENIFDMISLWNIRVLKSSTKSSKVDVAIPSKKFKDLMGANAKKGKIYDPPKGTKSFIEKLEVIKIEVKEKK